MDSNHRPYDYQSYALASWAKGPRRRKVRSAPFPAPAFASAENSARSLAPPLKIEPAYAGLRFCDFHKVARSALTLLRTAISDNSCSQNYAGLFESLLLEIVLFLPVDKKFHNLRMCAFLHTTSSVALLVFSLLFSFQGAFWVLFKNSLKPFAKGFNQFLIIHYSLFI